MLGAWVAVGISYATAAVMHVPARLADPMRPDRLWRERRD
jgi:hypothetical protein